MRDEHLPEESLQQYVDGELPDTKAAAVRQHLDTCWLCRTRYQEIVQTIGEFVRYFERTDNSTPRWPDLALLLDRTKTSRPDDPKPAFLRWRWAAGTLMFAAFAGTALYWPYPATPPRQAPPVLSRPAKQTAALIRPLPSKTTGSPAESPVELYILAALYDTGADLGGGIEYRQSGTGQYVVNLPPMGGAQEAALAERLRRIPGVTVAPYRTGDAKPAAAPVLEGTFQAGGDSDARLLTAAGSRQTLERLSNAILDRSDAILLRAHALARIDRAKLSRLSTEDAELLARIRTGHRKALQQDCVVQRAALRPLLQPFKLSETAVENWTTGESELRPGGRFPDGRVSVSLGGSVAELAQQADDALHSLLAGAPSTLSAEQLAARISAAIERLCEQLSSY